MFNALESTVAADWPQSSANATGVFADGSCEPNPGEGGWGAVWVQDGVILDRRSGHEPATTNNRMELTALIWAYRMLQPEAALPIYSDSTLCVNTVNRWAAAWEARGWKKRKGALKNLDLVQTLLALARSRPACRLIWVRGHAGNFWNEYADRMAEAARRREQWMTAPAQGDVDH